MCVTDDPALAERCRSLRNLCFQAKQRFVHEELGWNYRMTNLQAALGLAQLERLDESLKRKREIGMQYHRAFADCPSLQLPITETSYAQNLYWVFGIVIMDRLASALHLMRSLALAGVGTRPFFYPLHQQPVFRSNGLFGGVKAPVAETLAMSGFYIPSGLALTDVQLGKVIAEVRSLA